MSQAIEGCRLVQAIKDPASVFENPGDILEHDELSPHDKKKILNSWEIDQRILLIAESNTLRGQKYMSENAAEKLKMITRAKQALS